MSLFDFQLVSLTVDLRIIFDAHFSGLGEVTMNRLGKFNKVIKIVQLVNFICHFQQEIKRILTVIT